MRKYIAMIGVLVVAVGTSLNAMGQYDGGDLETRYWPEGKVILTNGDTIYGPLTLYPAQDVINVQNPDGTVSAFSPVNVQYFVAQEQPSGKTYLFRTKMWDLGRAYSDFKKPTFFEQLNQGALTLMRRELPVTRSTGSANSVYDRSRYNSGFYPVKYVAAEQGQELYYVLLPNGEIVTLRNVRKDLHRLFGKKSGEVKEYVKEKNLDYERPYKLVAIINYFNSL